MKEKIAVVIVHFSQKEETLSCLDSLRKTNTKHSLIFIVVDNSLENKFADTARKYPKVKVVSSKRNLGVAGGNNLGIKEALRRNCEFILLLNPDTQVPEDFFDPLIAFAKKNSDIKVVSPKIYFYAGYEFHRQRYKKSDQGRVIWYAGGKIDWDNVYATHERLDQVDDGSHTNACDTDFATGCCMLFKAEIIEKVGLLDEKYFLYFEDVDFSQKVIKSGGRVVYFPHVFLWHKNAMSSDKPGSSLHVYYQTRNRLYFGFRYAPARAKKSLFIDSIRQFLKGGILRKAVLDYYLGKMGKGSI